ncbi:MAG: hypothetical protein AAF415_13310 [Pseudomonadota bacterium]
MKRLRTLALGLAALAIPAQAVALSCAQPSMARLFDWARESGEAMVIGHGGLSHDGPRPAGPKVTYEQDETGGTRIVATGPTTATYRFEGDLLTPEGRLEKQSLTVTVEAICLASWCGGFPADLNDALIALAPTDDEEPYKLTVGPCPGEIDMVPSAAKVEALERCMAADNCGPTEHKMFDN